MVLYGCERQISEHSNLAATVRVGIPDGVSLKLKWVELIIIGYGITQIFSSLPFKQDVFSFMHKCPYTPYSGSEILFLSKNRYRSKLRRPITARASNAMKKIAGKIACTCCDWFWFCFSLVGKLARDFFSQSARVAFAIS